MHTAVPGSTLGPWMRTLPTAVGDPGLLGPECVLSTYDATGLHRCFRVLLQTKLQYERFEFILAHRVQLVRGSSRGANNSGHGDPRTKER